MLTPAQAARRALPSVDRLLKSEAVGDLIARYGRPLVVETVRALLDEQRAAIAASGESQASFDEAAFITACGAQLAAQTRPSLRRVFNLTGTVLHTNLGRALMPKSVAEAVAAAMTHPVNLEFDLGGGARGERDSHVERWLRRLTGAEAAIVVNNNAAAVYLTLNTLASRKEVLVSRGELIEIGGAFRMPDIMARAGCKLVEVGTTNRTHLADYASAISPRTAAIMKVHASNYSIEGFTAAVGEPDLAGLAHEHRLPFIVDLGSGMLIDLEDYGLPHEPTPHETLAHGADLVTFSGDKLLGGPQAGLVVGKKDLVARLKKNPLKRALRVDKMTLAALEAVLRLYSNPERLEAELPTLRWLTRPLADIEAQAARVLPHVAAALAGRAEASLVSCSSQIGSGSLPVDLLPSVGIAIGGGAKRRHSLAEGFAAAFRALPVPVIGRINEGAFIMDLRCLDDEAGFIAQLGELKIEKSIATENTEFTERIVNRQDAKSAKKNEAGETG
ncbi:MAG: L-seryl-tRNA(Sec) selenium transferase [Betaproteobacteria bacterium]|nr:L-seryl-tRNA(Sec) selenium transferase [Betaproteobacteria bacterium]